MVPSGIFASLPRGYIQVAGVLNIDEARMLARSGVDLIAFPAGPGVRSPGLTLDGIARIARTLSHPPFPSLITYHSTAGVISAASRRTGVAVVQLHGAISWGEIARIRGLCPGLTLVRSLIVRGADPSSLLREVASTAPFVDAFLTDTHDPHTGANGATGKTHDWSVTRAIVHASPHPVILAGGLTPDNVAMAIRTARPAGVDAHTGLEGPYGEKDPERVQQFVEEARATFREVGITPGGGTSPKTRAYN